VAIGEQDLRLRSGTLEPPAQKAKALTPRGYAAQQSHQVTNDDLKHWKERASTAEATRSSGTKETNTLQLNGVLFDLDVSDAAKRERYNQKSPLSRSTDTRVFAR
jgi:hypothetical protein